MPAPADPERRHSPASLRDFARDVYGRPGVSEACLALQSRLGADVTVLLAAVWVGAVRRVALGGRAAQDLADAVADWRSTVVLPLRAIRTDMKQAMPPGFDPDGHALREAVKQLELRAEFMQLDRLQLLAEALEPADDTPAACARQSLTAAVSVWADTAPDAAPDTIDMAAMDRLLAAALDVAQDGAQDGALDAVQGPTP